MRKTTAITFVAMIGASIAQAQPQEQAIVTIISDISINLPAFNSGAPFLSADELTIIFTSNRQDPQGTKPAGKDNVYMAHRPTVYQPFADVRQLSSLLNKKAHYGVLGQTIDGRKYFVYDGSHNNIYVLEGVLQGKQKLTDISKYYGIKIKNRYDIFSCAISADEKTFYLCQALPGGKGGVDIWFTKRSGDGKWSEFSNLEKVNTENHEITVSFALEGEQNGIAGNREILYFSSNGKYDGQQVSFGGYDIYRYDIEKAQVKHIGAPINTPNNDVYYTAVPSFPDHAYYSRERPNEKGTYDIYFVNYKTVRDSVIATKIEQVSFVQEKQLEEGQVTRERALTEAEEAKRRADSVIAATDAALKAAKEREQELLAQQQERERRLSEEASQREDRLRAEQRERERRIAEEALQREERLRAEQREREKRLAEEQVAREQELAAVARRREENVATPKRDKYSAVLAAQGYKDMNSITNPKPGDRIYLRNLLFEKNKSVLMSSSYPMLDELYNFLIKFPTIVVEIGGHTSSEGSYELNLRLSRERALSVKNYLISRGILAERLFSRGYAYAYPIDLDESAEFGRTLNRRVEVTVIE